MNWLKDLVGRILLPPLLAALNAKFDELQPKLLTLLSQKLDELKTEVVQAAVIAVARSAGQLTVNTVDKITDVLPGPVDDRIIDPIVRDVMTQLTDLFGGRGR